jgi:hypothetical protein
LKESLKRRINMDFDKYENKLEYGIPSDSPKRKLCEHRTASPFDYKKDKSEYCSVCGVKIGDKRREILAEDKELKEAYEKESSKLYNLFAEDLFEEFGVTNNPKKDKCFARAWEHGHSSGYSEVYNYFSDFVELIK